MLLQDHRYVKYKLRKRKGNRSSGKEFSHLEVFPCLSDGPLSKENHRTGQNPCPSNWSAGKGKSNIDAFPGPFLGFVGKGNLNFCTFPRRPVSKQARKTALLMEFLAHKRIFRQGFSQKRCFSLPTRHKKVFTSPSPLAGANHLTSFKKSVDKLYPSS